MNVAVRLHDHLDAAVALVAERSIRGRRIFECNTMCDHKRRVEIAALDSLEQRTQVAHHMGLPHLQRESLCERGAERHFIDETAVHAGDGYGSALSTRVDRLTQCGGP